MKQKMRNRIAQMIVLSAIGLSSICCTQGKAASVEKFEQIVIPSTKSSATEQGEQIPLLELGKSIEKELKSDEFHSYQIEAEASQYLQAEVMQKGIDVVVSIFDPSGKKVYEVDSPNGTEGPETVYLITESKGRYRLEVRSLENTAKPGKYEVKLEQLRASNQEDKSRAAAYKALEEAVLLGSQRDPKSREEAIKRYEEAIRLFEEAKEETQAASSCNSLAGLYYGKGDYSKAEPLFQRALAIREKALGSEHPLVATSLNNLASLYDDKGDYGKAEPLYQRSLAIREKVLGPEHPSVATSLNNLAFLYHSKGDYGKAEPFYQRSLAIFEKALGPQHPDVAVSLNNLAGLYKDKGDYSKAEPLYQRSLAIFEKALGPDHLNVAGSLNSLALLYTDKGDYGKAEPLYQRSLAIREKVLGPEHPLIANSLNNLAGLYDDKGDHSKAEPLFQRALAIREKALGSEHPSVATSLNNLALLYERKGDYGKAEPLYQRSLAIFEKALGSDHPSVATAINGLAALYYKKGDYSKAEPLLQRSLAIREKALGSEHPDVADSLNNLAALYDSKGEIKQAISYKTRANECSERDLVRNLIAGSENEKLIYLNRVSRDIHYTLSLHLQSAPDDLTILQVAMTILLQRKGRALDAMTQSIESLRRRAAPDDQLLLDKLAQARAQLSASTLRGPGKEGVEKHKDELKTLADDVEALEKQISERSKEFKVQIIPITSAAVQQAVPSNAALVEFAVYRPYDAKTRQYAAARYAVYVMKSNGELRWAELGEAAIIDIAVKEFRQILAMQRDKSFSNIEREVKPKARALDKLVMEKARRLLGDAKRLLIAPDGNLNLIPFDALVDETGKYLVESYEISYLTSGRDLLRLQNGIPSKQGPMVMADPDFGSGPGPKLGDNAFEPLKRLNASAKEANQIKAKMTDATTLMQGKATKDALNNVSRPSILHIATHGFFLEDEPISYNAKADFRSMVRRMSNDGGLLQNPLLRSGLFFAGANAKGQEATMTAMEATGLDLWGTKLVVLSACDTGVGEASNGEGVYGLRRALVLAGSESQMMSLWPVSDKGTRDLMIAYYEALKAGEGRSAGLRRVRLEMLKKPEQRHPYYWASFIQSGEWANLDGKR